MFRLLAHNFTLIHLRLTQHNPRVQIKFNSQPNKSRYVCLLSNNIKMSTCRLARDRSYLEHHIFAHLVCLQGWDLGRTNLCRREAGICVVSRVCYWCLQFSVSQRCLISLDSVQAILHMDMCTLSVILVQIWPVRAAAVWRPTVLHKHVPTTSQHASGSQKWSG